MNAKITLSRDIRLQNTSSFIKHSTMSDDTAVNNTEILESPFKKQTPFPLIVNGKINTEEFLAASRDVVKIVEKFGKLFAPVKHDMLGNIEKLTTKYNIDRLNHVTLHDMILLEKATGDTIIATDALQWLRRGLYMILLFFEKIVQDHKAGNTTEDLVAFLKISYKEALEPYHGWMAQQLFGLLSRMVPTRTQLLDAIADGQSCDSQILFQDMDIYLKSLRKNIENLHQFYKQEDLEDPVRV